ncbi:hypothetical protein FB565_004022 [Actinoplanes lutulentus]|uniref:Protein kinase domain-containing protein n=1 Tax=Actinoplanes lutulentus TaxID=1287878 RepID=A0A327ZMY3_9ACTN|nr:serine/threonine-protein kinase [Actinoplanes lutulentus]MBB2944293.1 hypothetical protein [Actinoplanes lutulentus]RAK42474.1 hypothetical protein B0I29_102299 [Actinoplanes lutulentus]
MSARARVRAVHTSSGRNLPGPGALLGFRFRPGGLGTYQHVLETVDGQVAPPLIIGFPVRGGRAGEHLRTLHRALANHPGLFPAAALWHGIVDLGDGSSCHALLAPDPAADGYLTLHETLLDGEPARTRFELAYSLAGAVRDLETVGAVHGGLDSATLLVRMAGRQVRIAEVESATLVREDAPLAVGAATGYLAPELYDDLGEHAEPATGAADRWSLAVAAHVLLTGFHPYHFLPDLSPATIAAYVASQTWPRHQRAALPGLTFEHASAMQTLPDAVLNLFVRSFQDGWQDPGARPSATEWHTTLGAWIGDPVIDELLADRDCVLAGESVTVSWRTRFAHRVLVDGVAADPVGSIEVSVDRPRRVVVRAIGPCGTVEAVTSRIEVVRIPPLRLARIRVPLVLDPGNAQDGDDQLLTPVPPPMRFTAPPAMPNRQPPPPRPVVPSPPRPSAPAFPRMTRTRKAPP